MVIKSFRLKKEEDKRGWVLQGLQYSKYFEKKVIKDVIVQTINIGEKRGEHYHRKKIEWFLPLDGMADLFWCEFDGKITKEIMDSKNYTLFQVEPFTCHWIQNTGEKIFLMIAFSTEEYDPNNRDIRRCMSR